MQVTAYLLLCYLQMYCIGFFTAIYLCAVVLSNVTYLKCEIPVMKTQVNTRNYFFNEHDALFVSHIFQVEYCGGTNPFIALRESSQN